MEDEVKSTTQKQLKSRTNQLRNSVRSKLERSASRPRSNSRARKKSIGEQARQIQYNLRKTFSRIDPELLGKNFAHFKTMGHVDNNRVTRNSFNTQAQFENLAEEKLDKENTDFENRLSFNDRNMLDKYLHKGSLRNLEKLDYGSFKHLAETAKEGETFSNLIGKTNPSLSAKGLLYQQKKKFSASLVQREFTADKGEICEF